MRLPWEQLTMEVIEVTAPELADKLYPELEPEDEAALQQGLAALGIEKDFMLKAVAGWGIVEVIKWSLARCPDHEPPSANAIVKGPTAAKQIARAAGFRGDPKFYVQTVASVPYPTIEALPEGIRFRGIDRYDGAWGDRNKDAWVTWKAAHPEAKTSAKVRRRSGGTPAEIRRPDPDADAEKRKTTARRPRLVPPPPPTPPAQRQWDATTPAGQMWNARLDDLRGRGATYAAVQLERFVPELVDGRLVVTCDDAFFGSWCDEQYGGLLRQAGLEVGGSGPGPPIELRYPAKAAEAPL